MVNSRDAKCGISIRLGEEFLHLGELVRRGEGFLHQGEPVGYQKLGYLFALEKTSFALANYFTEAKDTFATTKDTFSEGNLSTIENSKSVSKPKLLFPYAILSSHALTLILWTTLLKNNMFHINF